MQVIYGVKPVMEALRSDSSKIKKIVVASGRRGENVRNILKLAEQNKIETEFEEKKYLEKLAGGNFHQGIVCLCDEYSYASADKVINNCCETLKNSLILILDGITDPQNLGSLIRTAHCCGVNGVIVPENRAASVTPAVMKVSAGAAHHIPIVKVVNISNTIDYLKEKGFWIYGADAKLGQDVHSFDYGGHIALVMGSEEKGIRPLVRRKCDFFVSIPIWGEIDSLNVSVAAGIILYEITRKRFGHANIFMGSTHKKG
ncbi:MAG: 23S rRNA (guanosine(2251)-2'-O)-methyltransferase RlmB [Thermodesulfobacteriota bacterium]|nr:23S rRNA (guanosine(2251)-2'-O)-methyltransferase RlmB [Thermodesulfobacteriota bacterium]